MAAAGKKILKVAIADLTLDPENARKHGDRDIEAIAASLEQFGQQTPIVITVDKLVVKGNGTVMAAMKLGWTHIEAVQTTLSGAELRAYAIADNKTGLLSEWDTQRLVEQLQLLEDEPALLVATGFSTEELLELLPSDGELVATGDRTQVEQQYTNKIVAPVYTPKGEQPPVAELLDRDKADELIEEIRRADLPVEVAGFLIAAAQRHVVFNFRQIAEYYCHAAPQVQDLMERSGLVIIDFDKAIENGFVHLTERLGALADIEQYGGALGDGDELEVEGVDVA